jgi:hypothetical protein
MDSIVYLAQKGLAVLLFFVSNSDMVAHIDRQRQTPEGVFSLFFILIAILNF